MHIGDFVVVQTLLHPSSHFLGCQGFVGRERQWTQVVVVEFDGTGGDQGQTSGARLEFLNVSGF